MIRALPLSALGLALFAAAPASAQVGSSTCQPHRNGEVRCAVRIDIPGGNRVYDVVINATEAFVITGGIVFNKIGDDNAAWALDALDSLGVDVIDLFYLHRVDPAVPIEETVGAMARAIIDAMRARKAQPTAAQKAITR